MNQMQDIYNEYSRMRQNGMDAKAVLNTLRGPIAALSKPERDELANRLRGWEARAIPTPAAPPASNPERTKLIKPLKPISAAAPQSATAPAAQEVKEVTWVICTNCGKSNQKHEVFCYSCGQLLDAGRSTNETRNFNSPDSGVPDSEYFGTESVLALRVRGSAEPYEVRLNKADHEIILGRVTSSSAMSPDIDLSAKQGADLGVSRMHLSIRYDLEN
ncbi:MAG: hypothetical protein K8I30_07360, partial [Anaerolineae bacterium]|nr:hypothetical protein [Anaerolineae bacterium]